MAKQGEIQYLSSLGENGRRHAFNKPFSDAHCPNYLMELGAVMALLPPPPLHLLDVGCGTGWTSRFFARRGYDVLGVDISADMIQAARQISESEGLENVQYLVSDYEDMNLDGEYDAAVFYDALHHAVDEEAALGAVYRALKPGGVCVTSEPGRGHARSAHSQTEMARFNVTEKDMPPGKIIGVGRKVGFRAFQTYPHAYDLSKATYQPRGKLQKLIPAWPAWLRKLCLLGVLNAVYLGCRYRTGIVVLTR
jgi:SAM-dependent methyltransferase